MKQKTIAGEITIEGVGLHTGTYSSVLVKPAPVNHGYVFKRMDLEEQPLIPADVSKVVFTERGTRLSHKAGEVATVEHLLSGLYALGIDNVLIEIDNVEVPILDGSAAIIVNKILEVGIEEQDEDKEFLEIKETIRHYDEESGTEIIISPADTLAIKVMIDFDSEILNSEFAMFDESVDYRTDIAPARTFVFLHELEPLLRKGLIKGGDLENAVVLVDKVISDEKQNELATLLGKEKIEVHGTGVLNTSPLRFLNEPARHKLLDILGDIALLGRPIKGRIHAYKPGHKNNIEFTKLLKQELLAQRKLRGVPHYDPNEEPLLNSIQVMELLPHRYPFLLVDKVIEMSDTHVVGVKNVTFDEAPFLGHFPGNPVFPGVLQIEAMAQTGGILALNIVGAEGEWDTYFLKIDKVKFKRMVVPGDTLVIKMELLAPIRRGICQMRGTAYVGNKLVSEGELVAQIVKRTTD